MIPGSFSRGFPALVANGKRNFPSTHRIDGETKADHFLYLQLDEEGYKKQEVTVGADNGKKSRYCSA